MDKYNNISIEDLVKQASEILLDKNPHASLNEIYFEDDNLLFNNYLNNKLFINEYSKEIIFPSLSINLIVRPECNQTCEYCYIYKYGDELYPKEQRVSNKITLSNIQKLLKYFLKRKCYIPRWELFAGDLFYDNLWFDLMDVFYEYFKEMLDIPLLEDTLKQKKIVSSISIPCNFSFCHDKNKVELVQKYIDKFAKLHVRIHFSYSHDGYYSLDVREKKELTEDYYNTVFNFIKKNGFGTHPMISYEGIKEGIQNYEWWKEQYKKYDLNYGDILPMFLEVRNDGWTKENIQDYLNLLNYMIEDRLKMCDNNIGEFAKHIFSFKEKISKLPPMYNNDLIRLKAESKQNTKITCNMGHGISIKSSNLTIVPCHRMAYPYFEAGQFVVKDGEITHIEIKNNVDAYYAMTNGNFLMFPKCAACEYRFFCMKGCLGSQYETFGDYNIPIQSVCDLFQAKIDFLFKKYHELGVFKYYFDNISKFTEEQINSKRVLEFLLYKGYKEYDKYL